MGPENKVGPENQVGPKNQGGPENQSGAKNQVGSENKAGPGNKVRPPINIYKHLQKSPELEDVMRRCWEACVLRGQTAPGPIGAVYKHVCSLGWSWQDFDSFHRSAFVRWSRHVVDT